MIVFWVGIGLLSAATATLILFRASRAAGAAPVDTTVVFYQRQLAEIADLAERGLLGDAERKSAEAEAGRRMLANADSRSSPWSSEGGRMAVLAAAMGAPAVALGLYFLVGAPGRPDQPFEGRLAQWKAANPESLAPQEMAAVLSRLTEQRPNDPEGFRFLALAEGASDNPAAAVRALKRGLRLAPDRADLWEMLGEALVYQAGGQVHQDAQDAFGEALKRDPTRITARFNLARAQVSRGDKAGGVAAFQASLAGLSPGDPRAAALQAAIGEAQGAPAPQAEGVTGDQMTAIRGMVAGLAARLQAKPDDPEGWVRLVRAYAVLGETQERDAALKSAQDRYRGKADVMDALKAAAEAAPMKSERGR